MNSAFFWIVVLLGVAMLAFVARHFAEEREDAARPPEDDVPDEDRSENTRELPPDLGRAEPEEKSEEQSP